MPRRQFIADIQKARQEPLPDLIQDLRPGDDDGQFEFSLSFHSADGKSEQRETINALVPDLDAYPKGHEYMIFATDDAPPHITSALQKIKNIDGKSVSEVLRIISGAISNILLDRDGDTPMRDSQADASQPEEQDSDEDDVYDSDHEAFAFDLGRKPPTDPNSGPSLSVNSRPVDTALRARIRQDLRAVKDAGFKVGKLGFLLEGDHAFVTVAIRISKLGISEEAMEAWNVDPKDYLILIIQYVTGYRTHEEMEPLEATQVPAYVGMRVVAGKSYKPTFQEAIKAFTIVKSKDHLSNNDIPAAEDFNTDANIRDTFISKPLASLLQERLIPILRYRKSGMSWYGAEQTYQARVNSAAGSEDPKERYIHEEPNKALPRIVSSDHFRSQSSHHSFPLLAMQFLLRHFVRCTEFCLVCHRKLETDVEAIKPYVCDSNLCLYQYMSLGFGPSIEHEILSQPYVVDLLVSFLYNSAASKKLSTLPDGLSLRVPPCAPVGDELQFFSNSNGNSVTLAHDVMFDKDRNEITIQRYPALCPVKRGDWVVIKATNEQKAIEYHCFVEDTSCSPRIITSEPVEVQSCRAKAVETTGGGGKTTDAKAMPAADAPKEPTKPVAATLIVYSTDFDQLDTTQKQFVICKALDTLPDVLTMRSYLMKPGQRDLRSWEERISPAALTLLRWCIASNRACIMQSDGELASTTSTPVKKRERLSGMKDYMQFRFAMGAPDKEQRFISEVRKTARLTKTKYPTIFAFHGSPLYNWHMIIREGLHYKQVSHGRAYGHGVYHARDAGTSTGYSGLHGGYGYGGSHQDRFTWPQSILRVTTALALNELVNDPPSFASTRPYYVIQQLDWIQTRYLFVQVRPRIESVQVPEDEVPKNVFQQDPQHFPSGVSGPIVIPAGAMKTRWVSVENERPKLSEADARPQKRMRPDASVFQPFAQSHGNQHQSQNLFPFIPMPSLPQQLSLNSTPLHGSTTASQQNPFAYPSHHFPPQAVPTPNFTPHGSTTASPDYESDDVESVCTNASDRDVIYGEDQSDPSSSSTKINGKSAQGLTTDFEPGTLDFSTLPLMPMPVYAVSGTTRRLMKDLTAVKKVQDATHPAELGWWIDVEKIENAYQWIVELHSFHTFSIRGQPLPLAEDMANAGVKSIVLEIRFNKDFPYTPPYVRVVRPRFKSFNQGGGGHIVLGGAMCMELLTNTGWSSVSSMESVLMQIRMAIASEPFARLDFSHSQTGRGRGGDGRVGGGGGHAGGGNPSVNDYQPGEAADGYIRACQTHGWEIPPGFREMAYGLPSAPVGAAGSAGPVGPAR